jgi:hypothetical protein
MNRMRLKCSVSSVRFAHAHEGFTIGGYGNPTVRRVSIFPTTTCMRQSFRNAASTMQACVTLREDTGHLVHYFLFRFAASIRSYSTDGNTTPCLHPHTPQTLPTLTGKLVACLYILSQCVITVFVSRLMLGRPQGHCDTSTSSRREYVDIHHGAHFLIGITCTSRLP